MLYPEIVKLFAAVNATTATPAAFASSRSGLSLEQRVHECPRLEVLQILGRLADAAATDAARPDAELLDRGRAKGGRGHQQRRLPASTQALRQLGEGGGLADTVHTHREQHKWAWPLGHQAVERLALARAQRGHNRFFQHA